VTEGLINRGIRKYRQGKQCFRKEI